jgi:hypothetical protein
MTWVCDREGRREWDHVPNRDIALIYHYDLARALDGEPIEWQAIPVALEPGRMGGDICADARDFGKRRDLFGAPVELTAPPPTLGELRAMWANPDEGPVVSKILYQACKNSYEELADKHPDRAAFINAITSQAARNGVSVRMDEDAPTLRRFEITRGLIRLAGADCDDEDVRLCVATAMDSDAPLMPAVAVGWAVGGLGSGGVDEAKRFAQVADDHVDGRTQVIDDRLVAVGVA